MLRVPESGLLRLPEILRLIPVSASSWWRGVRGGRYPAGIKLGARTTVWRAEDIKALIKRMRVSEG
ncbi:MAG: AlpA family phage regulatory protein [Geobacter sp.]|nr:MAG: AlpA family phage regulatory protein [Geobacter sp.]